MNAKELARQYYNLIENNYDSLQDLEEFFETYANYKNKELYGKIVEFRNILNKIKTQEYHFYSDNKTFNLNEFLKEREMIIDLFDKYFNIEKV